MEDYSFPKTNKLKILIAGGTVFNFKYNTLKKVIAKITLE